MHRTWIVLLILILVSLGATGHRGGLDANGGHYDRQTNSYHCHQTSCNSEDSASVSSDTPATPLSPTATQSKSQLIATLPEYDRKDWNHWIDADGNCINTRHEILIKQATGAINRSPDGCYVSSGTWVDPYSGKTFHRTSEIDADHVIPLKWAHDHGGHDWSAYDKERFANDLDNLLAVSQSLNKAKGAQGPDQWLPPNHRFRCEYLRLWQKLLAKYQALKMTSAEQRIFGTQLSACK